jgi:hypothetical protein
MHSSASDEALRHLTAPFARRDDAGDIWSGANVFAIDRDDLPLPSLVLFVLTRTMGLVDLGVHDKTRWHVPFGFRGHRVTLAFQKFGMRMYIDVAKESGESAQAIAADVVRILKKVIRIVEKTTLADIATRQLAGANVTIANQSGRLRAMYEHFRAQAKEAFGASQLPPQKPKPEDGVGALFAAVGDRIGQEQKGAWETIATVNAYFSLLEHEMVLLFAFADLDPADGELQTFIGDRWGLKFKRLFDVSERSTKRVYEALHAIAETYRNPYSHGGFEKGSAALWFHVPGVAAMPARLSDYRDSPHFEVFPVQPESFDKICATLDGTERWLRQGIHGHAFDWIDSGLDIAFDAESRESYGNLAADARRRQGEIERRSHLAERAENMDF